MRTIQKYLADCDRDAIIDAYIRKYVTADDMLNSCVLKSGARDATLGEYFDGLTAKLNRLIDNLVTAKPVHLEEDWILFAAHRHDGYITADDIAIYLAKKADIESGEELVTYAYDLCTFAEVVNYYVADTNLTQNHIDELIVVFMYEMSWYGVDQEHLPGVIDRLLGEDGGPDSDNTDDYISFEEMQKEDERDSRLEEIDPGEKKAYYRMEKYIDDYNELCRNLEAAKIRDALLK